MPHPKDDPSRAPDAQAQAAASSPKGPDESAAAVGNAVREFTELVRRYGGSSADRFILTAMLHPEVQQALARHIEAKDVFVGAQCIPTMNCNEVHVVFDFRCSPPRFCLVPPRLLVVLDAYTGRLVRQVDPYNALIEQQESVAR